MKDYPQISYGGSATASMTADSPERISAFEDLDRELERLDKIADVLRARLGPILNQYALPAEADTPKPEPSSQLRGRIERLREIGATFDRVIRDIDL